MMNKQVIIDEFSKIIYATRFWGETRWMGVQAQKLPTDFWIYQEILWETRPDIIIECGTALGGGALFFASICELIGKGRVVTIDSSWHGNRHHYPQLYHKRIRYLVGSTVSQEIIKQVAQETKTTKAVMVNLDSSHGKEHVLEELKLYNRFVTPGCYLIVEDTNVNGHPVYPEFGPGPFEALEEFLKINDDFEIDRKRERFILTSNPRGFLRRKR